MRHIKNVGFLLSECEIFEIGNLGINTVEKKKK